VGAGNQIFCPSQNARIAAIANNAKRTLARKEEAWLTTKFPEDVNYSLIVKKLIPGVY
jgi:hypothetical protein